MNALADPFAKFNPDAVAALRTLRDLVNKDGQLRAELVSHRGEFPLLYVVRYGHEATVSVTAVRTDDDELWYAHAFEDREIGPVDEPAGTLDYIRVALVKGPPSPHGPLPPHTSWGA